MVWFELRCKRSTNRRYIYICIGSVSGWALVIVRLVELGGIRINSGASVPVLGGIEVLGASKGALGQWTETRVGTMMVICMGFAWRELSRVASWLLRARIGHVFQNIFVSRYFLGRVRCGWP